MKNTNYQQVHDLIGRINNAKGKATVKKLSRQLERLTGRTVVYVELLGSPWYTLGPVKQPRQPEPTFTSQSKAWDYGFQIPGRRVLIAVSGRKFKWVTAQYARKQGCKVLGNND